MRSRSEVVKWVPLMVAAGLLTPLAIEEIVPESHEPPDPRFAALAPAGGFSLFTMLAVSLGGGRYAACPAGPARRLTDGRRLWHMASRWLGSSSSS